MFGSQVLEVVIGLIFVYLLLSLICTAAGEMIAALLSLRSRNLAQGIAGLLADAQIKDLDSLFYQHPLIKSLCKGTSKPSYIPPHFFSLALLDGIAPFKAEGSPTLADIRAAINDLPGDSELRRILQIFLQQAGDDFPKFKTHIENWFDDAMTRASGWYKRKSQMIILILAILVTGATNADTLQIVMNLSADTALRSSIASMAKEFAGHQPGKATSEPEKPSESNVPSSGKTPPEIPVNPQGVLALENLQQLGIPLGWQAMPKKEEWENKIIGLLLTICAISLGAPFWFDTLNRIIKIRSSGSVPKAAEAPAKEGKQD